MDSHDPLVLIFSRNAFYKRLHYLVLGAFAISLMMIALLVWILVYLLQNPNRPLYFATDDVSRLINVVPVNTPNMTTEDVMEWAIEAVEAAYSYDYINYRDQLQKAQKYFTNYGWRNYMGALSLSGNIRGLVSNKQIVTAQVIDKPKIVAEGMLGGAYAWKFDMPLLVTYSTPPYDGSADAQFSNALNVTVIVQRQQVLEGYKGLGVLQLVSSMATQSTVPSTQMPSSSTG